MSKYASLLFSPEKYHEISPFRFPIYEDLVPGEAKGIEKLTRDQSKNTFKSIKVAQRIAKAKGISTKEAVELLSKIGSEEDSQDFLYEYASELEDLQSDSLGNVETKVAYVTLFMQYRAEAQINGKRKWERLEDWGVEDTEAMPTKILDDIFQLLLWERDGWPKAGNDEAEPES